MKTKFNLGQKVFIVKSDNIFECKIYDINVREHKNIKEETRIETYTSTFEEHTGMLQCDLRIVEFDDKSTNVFTTKKEALAFIEVLKDARIIIGDNSDNIASTSPWFVSALCAEPTMTAKNY
jgi:hypothetical protein